MYAVIRTGGKQYKVQAGDVVQVEKLDQDLGAEFVINDVLMIGGDSTHVGVPLVKDAKVTVVVTKQAKARKVLIFKKKRRQGYRRLKTHRQEFTELFVVSITAPGGQVSKTDAKANVVDVTNAREGRILQKQADRQTRIEGLIGQGRAAKAETKAAATKTKVAKKKVAKKAAKKKVTAKKASGKKAAKKAAKKTSKKA